MQTVPRLIHTFAPTDYDLSLVLEREQRTFSGTVTIEGEAAAGAIALHSKDLTISTVTVDGKAATYAHGDNDQLNIAQDNLQPGKHIVVVGFSGTITDAMHGLYPCYYDHDGVKKELLATQFESHHAREVFPCVDEPEAKATFDVTLTTEMGITVLSNMPTQWQREESGKLVTRFTTTPRMSSYLLAWVTGELHKKSATTEGGVEVNIWATPAQPAESLDYALDIATRTIDFFDSYFDTPYPLPKSDHVALPDFSSGAMENWGLITYREIALLADPKTTGISSKRYIATVIAHELSHQWFGNLVTMKWWNNLWLNESFATLMEYIAVDALHPEWDIWLEFASHESIMALRRDAIDGVQPVQIDVNHPDEISTLFDGAIVYAKGARLLRMLQHYIGDHAFQAGLKQYFLHYAYGNTEGKDLWDELSEASGKPIADFMNTWISQPGYPVLHVTPDGLSQEQFFVGPHEPSTALWPIPLNALSEEDVPALMETKELHLPIADDERFNVGDSAHFITHYPTVHLARLIEQVRADALSPLDRLQLLHEQTMLARGGVISSAELIPLLDAYRAETVDSVWDIISLAIGELKKFVVDDEAAEQKLRELARRIAQQEYERLGWDMHKDEPDNDTKLRATILALMVYGEDKTVIDKAKELYADHDLEALDPELRALIICTVVRHSDEAGIVTGLLERYKTTSSAELQQDIAYGLTSTKDPVAIDLLLSQLTDSSVVRNQDVARWFVYLIRGKESREKTWQWVRDNWAWIEQTFSGDKSFDDYPRYAASGLTTRPQLEEYISFFTPLKEIPALTRVIAMGISEIEGRVDLIEHDGPAVRSALLKL
ncbi:MAG: aminopeptidase nonfunctional [Candidatus Saccharibacteria bacterium]|nr:aminopeptidase nonfunctional [Candidatus Saccharibacteria bacterium]